MAEQLKRTIEDVKNSNSSEEFERKARKILVESADALKMEFHRRMETLEVLNHVTKLSIPSRQEIERVHDRRGQVAANRMLFECIFRPDDGIFELLQALISTGQSKLVRELLEKIRSITRNATLIGILDGNPASASGGGPASGRTGASSYPAPIQVSGESLTSSQTSMPHSVDDALLRNVRQIEQQFGSVQNFYDMWKQQSGGT